MMHVIEVSPGAYMISAQFANELRARSFDHIDPVGEFKGIKIVQSTLLPLPQIVQHQHTIPNPNIGQPKCPRGKTVPRQCKRCGTVFFPRLADVKRGWGKFCSKSCKALYQQYGKA